MTKDRLKCRKNRQKSFNEIWFDIPALPPGGQCWYPLLLVLKPIRLERFSNRCFPSRSMIGQIQFGLNLICWGRHLVSIKWKTCLVIRQIRYSPFYHTHNGKNFKFFNKIIFFSINELQTYRRCIDSMTILPDFAKSEQNIGLMFINRLVHNTWDLQEKVQDKMNSSIDADLFRKLLRWCLLQTT